MELASFMARQTSSFSRSAPCFARPTASLRRPSFFSQPLSAVFMAMIFVAYGFLAHAFHKAVIESPQVQAWLRRGFAAAFAGLGANLAATER